MSIKPLIYFIINTLWCFTAKAQTTLYNENFNGQNGKGALGSANGITIDTSGVTWSVDTANIVLTAADDYFKVVSDTFEARDLDGPAKWISPNINIQNFANLSLSIYLSEAGTNPGTNYIDVYYSTDGGSEVLVKRVSGDFTSYTLTDTALAGTGNSAQLYVYSRNTAGTQFLRFDNIELKGTSTLDANSNIIGNNETGNVGTISSLLDTDAEAFSVLSFSVQDVGTTDASPTKITNVRVVPGTGNTADWTDHIQGVKLHNGSSFLTIGTPTITDTYIDIPISSGNMDIANNSTKAYTLYAYLNTSNIVDSSHLMFKIDPTAHGFTTDISGSSLLSTVNGGTTINSGFYSCYVIAEELKWLTQPVNSTFNVFMPTSPVVELVDVNGNRDLDFGNYPIKMISSGTLVGDTVSENAVNGRATFDSLKHNAIGTSLKLTAICNHLTVNANLTDTIISLPFNVGGQEGLSILQNNTVYKIDFDNTVDGINNGTFNGTGITSSPSAGQLNSNGISILGLSDGDIAFGGNGTTGDYARGTSNGGVTTGGIYSFQTSTGNYSLGFQPGGTDFTPGSVIIKVQNNTGDTIKKFLLGYHVYMYNDQGYATKAVVSYSIDGSTFASIDSSYSDEVADANPSWRKHAYVNFNSNLTILNGAYFYLKFAFDDSTGSGSRDEAAIDDIVLISYKNNVNLTSATTIEGDYNTMNINVNGLLVTATGNVQVYNQLKLNEGEIDLNGYRMTLGSTTADIEFSGGSSSSYCYGGDIRMHTNNTSGQYLFPFGADGSDYTKAQINFTSATMASGAYLEGNVTAAKHPNFEGSIVNYLNRYYTITQSGISNPIYTINLTYTDANVVGTESSLFPVKHDGSSWQRPTNSTTASTDTVGQGSVDINTNEVTWIGVNGFSIFGGAGDGVPLPVELLSFKGQITKKGNLLTWETASEINSDYFEVQKKVNSQEFKTINRLTAIGNSNNLLEYKWLDVQAEDETVYYRLKIVDRDGSFEYSKTILIDSGEGFRKNQSVVCWIAQNQLNLRGLKDGYYEVEILSTEGKILGNETINAIDPEKLFKLIQRV